MTQRWPEIERRQHGIMIRGPLGQGQELRIDVNNVHGWVAVNQVAADKNVIQGLAVARQREKSSVKQPEAQQGVLIVLFYRFPCSATIYCLGNYRQKWRCFRIRTPIRMSDSSKNGWAATAVTSVIINKTKPSSQRKRPTTLPSRLTKRWLISCIIGSAFFIAPEG